MRFFDLFVKILCILLMVPYIKSFKKKKKHSQTVIYITINHEILLQLFIGEFHAPRWSSAVNPHHPDTFTHLPLPTRATTQKQLFQATKM